MAKEAPSVAIVLCFPCPAVPCCATGAYGVCHVPTVASSRPPEHCHLSAGGVVRELCGVAVQASIASASHG